MAEKLDTIGLLPFVDAAGCRQRFSFLLAIRYLTAVRLDYNTELCFHVLGLIPIVVGILEMMPKVLHPHSDWLQNSREHRVVYITEVSHEPTLRDEPPEGTRTATTYGLTELPPSSTNRRVLYGHALFEALRFQATPRTVGHHLHSLFF